MTIFFLQESIPAALTKDKKRIEGQEVQVSPVWQSTLYITNFPENYDAADIQKLFEPVSCTSVSAAALPTKCPSSSLQFGEIFETRWPSRRLKSTRRFVYVQYIDAVSSGNAVSPPETLSLIGYSLVFVNIEQTAAQRALTLHDTTIDGDASKRLQVRISDPLRKQTRSDANASKRELYITGLHKSATEADVEKLFAPVSLISWSMLASLNLTTF